MKNSKWLVVLGMLASASAFAQAGNGAGNGGDDLELESKVIFSDIRNWIEKGGPAELKGAPEDYSEAMLAVLRNGFIFELTSDASKTTVNGVEKVCVNEHPAKLGFPEVTADLIRLRKSTKLNEGEKFLLSQQKERLRQYMMQIFQQRDQHQQVQSYQMKIVCNRKTFPADAESRYRLLHHEIAGLAFIEVNEGQPASDYRLSDQLSGFLENVMVKRLRIGKIEAENKAEDEAPMLRCEGTWSMPDAEWTLKRRKDFIITGFENGDLYVSEIIHPLGATNSREITGGVRGNRTFKYSGIDKIAHFFTDYDQSPLVKVIKQDHKINLDEVETTRSRTAAQMVTVFNKPLYLNFNGNSGGYLWEHNGGIGGMALRCDDLSIRLPKAHVGKYQSYIEKLSKVGAVRLVRDQVDQDDSQREFDDVNFKSPRSVGW